MAAADEVARARPALAPEIFQCPVPVPPAPPQPQPDLPDPLQIRHNNSLADFAFSPVQPQVEMDLFCNLVSQGKRGKSI